MSNDSTAAPAARWGEPSEPLPNVPEAQRSEDGGMALVEAAVESANDAIIIFGQFRQSDSSAPRRQGALGFGLSIVKQLVEAWGVDQRDRESGESGGVRGRVKDEG